MTNSYMFLLPLIFGLVFCALGSFLLLRWRRARSWTIVTGRVIHTAIKTRVDKSQQPTTFRTTYQPEIRYEYTVKGIKFENDTYSLGMESTISNPKDVEAILERYKVGELVTVMYNPTRPKDSALIRGDPRGGALLLFLGVLFLAFSATMSTYQ